MDCPKDFDVDTPPDEAFPPAAASPGTIHWWARNW